MSVHTDIDVIVAGGSVSGLFAAREIATLGQNVMVLEEDLEIGEPEKCDGLVSVKGLTDLGIVPVRRVVQNEIKRAVLHSPNGTEVEIDASRQKVVVLDRKEFDMELAKSASFHGAEIRVGDKVESIVQRDREVDVKVGGDKISRCRFVVDATGVQSLFKIRRNGILQAAKYEIEASWIMDDTVELYFDQRVTPGFFTWVIPIGEGMAKVGTAGQEINSFRVLTDFVNTRGGKIMKKIAAPIVVSGLINKFVNGRVVAVGDAAGQTKPTTGGGIYTGGVAGILAGKAICRELTGEKSSLDGYDKNWRNLFGGEFRRMMLVRKAFEKMENHHLDRAFEYVRSSGVVEPVSEDGNFDLHSLAFLKALGIKNVLEMATSLAATELKELVSLIKHKAIDRM